MTKNVYVLWVRHCQSCANVAMKGIPNPTAQMFRQPLCTKKGVHQSYLFGVELGSKIHHIMREINDKSSSNNTKISDIHFYASYLPRAVETAKLISAGCRNKKDSRQINRMPFVSEHTRFYNKSPGSQNITDIYKSNCHCKALNSIIPNGLSISLDHKYEDIMKETICKSSMNKHKTINKCVITDTPNNYDNFKKYILPQLSNNKLNIIVSHGKYIRKEVLMPLDCEHNKLHNLEAHIVCYKSNASGEYEPSYVNNKYVNKCNKEVAKIGKPDISKLGLDAQYMRFFDCKYKFHDKSPVLRLKRKASIEKYCECVGNCS